MRILKSSSFCRRCSVARFGCPAPRCLKRPPRPEPSRPREGRAQVAARGVSPFTLRINFLGGVDDSIAAWAGPRRGPHHRALSGLPGLLGRDVRLCASPPRPRSLGASVRGAGATNRNLEPRRRATAAGGRARADGVWAAKRAGRGGGRPVRPVLVPWYAGARAALAQFRTFPLRIRRIRSLQRRAMSTQTAATINRRWNRETTTAFLYAYSTQSVPRQQRVRRRHSYGEREFFPCLRARARASAPATSALPAGTRMRIVRQCPPPSWARFDGGMSYARDLSPTRRILPVTGGGGASYVDTVKVITLEPYGYWTPTGYAEMSVGILRSWSAAASYRRAPMMLHGVTAESFITESASISIGGHFSRRDAGRVYGRVYRRDDKP